MATIRRRSRNKITRVRGNVGEWIEEQVEIGDQFSQFYNSLFSLVGPRDFSGVLECVEEIITDDDNRALMAEITREEVKRAVFQLIGQKALRPDSFTGTFYQKARDIIGEQAEKMLHELWQTCGWESFEPKIPQRERSENMEEL